MEPIRIGSKNDVKTVANPKVSHYCAVNVLGCLKQGLSWWVWCGMQVEVYGEIEEVVLFGASRSTKGLKDKNK